MVGRVAVETFSIRVGGRKREERDTEDRDGGGGGGDVFVRVSEAEIVVVRVVADSIPFRRNDKILLLLLDPSSLRLPPLSFFIPRRRSVAH